MFILFALLSNTGFYTVSGVKDHFFNVVVASESTWDRMIALADLT